MSYTRQSPSPRYLELLEIYKTVHNVGFINQNIPAEKTFSGGSLTPHLMQIKKLLDETKSQSLLDYGSGKASKYQATNVKIENEVFPSLKAFWTVYDIVCYDPAYEPFSRLPERAFDAVICTDVLEHIPETDVPWILEEQFRYATRFLFANVACYPAAKELPNGENAHCTIRPPEWWENTIKKAHTKSGSNADYLFLIETKTSKSKWFGLKKKQVAIRSPLSNRADWMHL